METRIPSCNRKQSSSRQMSMSDTESQMETTFHSPEQSDSPFRDPFWESNSKAAAALPPPPHPKAILEKYYSPQRSPAAKLQFDRRSSTRNDSTATSLRGGVEDGRRSASPPAGGMLSTAANLVLRVAQALFCLISFSVMAADQTQGWTGDSWHRYKEYRY
ncbi:unnamed protein product, partial [Cuscuta europaea]